ncbi:MAG: hypothetical protein AAGD34_03030 [Pseudomonadota bacterium]
MSIPLIALFVALAAGYTAHRLATRKRRNPVLWTWASVIFIVPVAILLVLPASERNAAPV